MVSTPFSTIVRALLAALCLEALAPALLAAEAGARPFDIPAGEAADALRQFAQQSGIEVLYSPKEIVGIQTNLIRGDYVPRAALDEMVRGTKLVITQGKNSGALAITRVADPNVHRTAPSSGDRPKKQATNQLPLPNL